VVKFVCRGWGVEGQRLFGKPRVGVAKTGAGWEAVRQRSRAAMDQRSARSWLHAWGLSASGGGICVESKKKNYLKYKG
jgi:hypothetical protein